MKKISMLALFLVFCLNVAMAQIKPGAFELGAYAGYTLLDDFGGNLPKDNLLYGARVGVFMTDKVSFEPSFQRTYTDTERLVGSNDNAVFQSLRFNLLYNMFAQSRVNPFITGGLGWLKSDIDNSIESNDLDVNAGLGLRVFLSSALAVRLDARYVYAEVQSLRQHNYEGALGLSYLFGGQAPKDSDGDGVKDRKDACPNTASGALVDVKGCPGDDDQDGVFNGIDQCSGTAKGMPIDQKGCPLDTDGDQVPDGLDACPNTIKNAKVDAKGCPLDKDMDGVSNEVDECPNSPLGLKVNEKGCALDSDGDAITDNLDQCPDTALGVKVDEKGCPLVTKSRGVLQGVTFVSGSAELALDSRTILDDVAKDLNEFENVKVEVQGHTDSVGSVAINTALSQKRAEAVREYLILKGVNATRIEAKGYGPSMPITENKTKTGRAKNRRVELKWLD